MAGVNTHLPAPTNVNATVLTPTSIKVTWDQSSDVTGYLISCTSPASYAGNKNVIVNGGDTTSQNLTNLVENTPYVITIHGLAKDGRNTCSNKVQIKTSTAAPSSPPQDIKVTSDDPAILMVSWQPPKGENGDVPIIGYVIQYARVGKDIDDMIVNVPNDTTFTITGLYANAEYKVTVAAVNANGTGPFSKYVEATSGEDTPSEPQSLEKNTVTSTSVTLKWKPPKYSNGIITRYSIHYDGVDIDDFGDVSGDKMIGTVKGLTPDTVYSLKMRAYTRVGPGPPVNLAVKTCFPAPTNVKATVLTPNSVGVTWDQSLDVIGYLISCSSPAAYAGAQNVIVNGGDNTSHTFTNMIENTPYAITVQGLTGDGRMSDHSTEVPITTQKVAPSSPPQDIKVTSDKPAMLVVSWKPPLVENCNGSIIGYVIQYARVGKDIDDMIVNVPNDTTFMITGLYANAEYKVTVAAVNANGTGPFSKPITEISGEDIPSEPRQVKTCSVNSTSVTLLWNPPEYSNGVITHYSIYCDGVDLNQFGDVSDDQMTGTVEGLSPDTVYVLKLKAHTRVGPGPPVSLAVKTRLPAPTNVKATELTHNSIKVTWDELPEFSDYLVSCTSPASYAGNKNVMVNGVDTTSHTLTNLVENTAYVVTVQGLTKDGRMSDQSGEIPITTEKAAPSSSPQDIKVAGIDPAALVVTWQPPQKKIYNRPITGYVIQYARVGSDDKMIMNVPNDTKLTIQGLFANAKYSVLVAAVNANGTGPFSKPVEAISGQDIPSEPQPLEIPSESVTSTSVTLQWMPPEYPNGVITKYSVQYDGKRIDAFGDYKLNTMIGTIEGLTPNTEYVIEMIAYTRVGPGPPFSLPVRTSPARLESATPPTEVSLIPVGKPVERNCNGKHGGSYLWKTHGCEMMLPPGCADGTVNVSIQACLPSSTQEHPFVSAVFEITADTPNFKKPVTLRFPHCVNVKSKEDKEKLNFLLVHDGSYKLTSEYCEVTETVMSIKLTNLCKVYIGGCFASFSPISLSLVVPGLKLVIDSRSPGNEQGNFNKSCLDILILPKSHTEKGDWLGTYCIVWDIPTYLQHFKNKKWIKPSQQVFKRKVNFTKNTDEAIAEICLDDEDKDGDIIEFIRNKKISRRNISFAGSEKDTQSGDNSVVENFPRCLFLIHEKISSSSKLMVNGIQASEENSSEFNLASPASSEYKFEVHDHYSEDPGIVETYPSKPEELTVTRDGVTETKVLLSWKGPTPPDSSILEYEVQYRKPGEDLKKIKSSTCQCEVIGLAAATNYQFRVAAINSVGCGAFTDFVTQSTESSDKPSLKEIIDYKIRDEVAIDWHDLGVQLIPNNLQSQLGIIRNNNPADAKTCCTCMFEYWLEVDTAASWSKLIEKLRHINQNQLAETISRKILHDNT